MDGFHPQGAAPARELFAGLDARFAAVSEAHQRELLGRTVLDDRTQRLVLVAQYTVTRRHTQLNDVLGAALDSGHDAGELLEVILQTYVYVGPWVVADACATYRTVMFERGEAVPDLTARIAGKEERSLDDERSTWSEGDASDPRLNGLLERYGWGGISNGLRLRPGHHLNMLHTLDALDPHFLQTWLDAVYEGMYGRGVLDDRTRLLCVVGATLALGETHQSRRHMRAALRCGAAAREVLEVVFQTTASFGHPYVMPAAFDDLLLILEDEGRLEELLEADGIDGVMAIVKARVARRSGVQDGLDAP